MASISFASGVENEGAEQDELPQIRAQGEHPPRLRQVVNIRDSADRLMGYKVLEDAGPQGEPVCYTPNGDTAIGGVWDELGFVQVYSGGSYRKIKYTWELPVTESDKPTLLFFNYNGFSYSEWTGAFFDEYIVVDGPTVELVLELSNSEWTASINGQQLPESATSAISARIPSPVFKSRRNGLHTVKTEVSGDGPISISGSTDLQSKEYSYYQRGLVFLDEFPEYDPDYTPESEPPEPITIENRVAWSDGAELNDEDVIWSIGGGNGGKSGIGKSISVLWDPIDRIFARAAVGDEKKDVENFEEVPLELTVRTDIFEGPDWFFPITYKLEHEFGVPGAAELRIVKGKVKPGAFTDGNDQAELTAEAVLIGLSPGDYKIEWTVDVIDSSGDPVRNNLVSDGEGWEISAQWDGRDDSGEPVDDPQSHIFVIKVKACPDEDVAVASRSIEDVCCGGDSVYGVRSQDTGCISEEVQVAINTLSPVVSIFAEDPRNGGSPTALAVGWAPSGETDAQKKERLRLQESIFRWQTFGKSALYIKVEGVKKEDDEPVKVLVSNRNRGNFNKVPITVGLEKEGDAYYGTIALDDSLLHVGNSGTSYTVSEAYDPLNTTQVVGGSLIQAGGLYPQPLIEMGTIAEKAIDREEIEGLYPDNELPNNEVPPTPENLLALGFEPLHFRVFPINEDSPETVLKVQNSSDVLYWLFHGSHDGTIRLGGDRDIARINAGDAEAGFKSIAFEPDEIYSGLLKDVQTIFLASCSALDINDYNNVYTKQNADGSWPTAEDRVYGGHAWDKMTGTGENGTVLLGYYDLSLWGPQVTSSVMFEYGQALNIFSGVSDPHERQALAWLKSNLAFVERAVDESSIDLKLLGACAITPEYYYYIPYRLSETEIELEGRPGSSSYLPDPSSVDKVNPVYKVSRGSWGTNPTAWDENKEKATPVSLQGLTFNWRNDG